MAVSSLSTLEKSVLGGLVADAATLPVHWFYDTSKLKEVLGDKIKTPEFFQPMSTQFYSAKDFEGHYSFGQLSCYGEQTLMTLDYFKEKGKFEGGESFAQFMYSWLKKYTGRLDHPTTEFLEKADKLVAEKKPLFPAAGAIDEQTMFTFKVPVIALKMLNGPEEEYFKAVEEATRSHQNSDMCSKFAKTYATILKMAHGGSPFEAIIDSILASDQFDDEVKTSIAFAWGKKGEVAFGEDGWDSSLQEFVNELSGWLFEKYGGDEKFKSFLGLTCKFPGSFMAAIKIIGDTVATVPAAEFKEKAFEFAVRRNICIGGDNCGRTMVIGPTLVALGADIPQTFLDQYADFDKALEDFAVISKM